VAAYDTEEQQLEEIKKWWKENGTWVVIGVTIGVGLIFGWQWWQSYTEQQAQSASVFYEQILSALENPEKKPEQIKLARKIAGKLLSDHSGSPYGILAALSLARQDFEEGKTDSSHAHLQWVIDQNSSLAELTHIARLRKARLYLSEEKPAMAKNLIKGIEVGQFKGAYAELRGDIAVAEGQLSTARTAYKEALESEDLSGQHSQWVQMKLDDLGVEKAARIETSAPVSATGNPNTAEENNLTIPLDSTTVPMSDAESNPAITAIPSPFISTPVATPSTTGEDLSIPISIQE
jgi:predicted negative regulator of RcsB-dependent stress response